MRHLVAAFLLLAFGSAVGQHTHGSKTADPKAAETAFGRAADPAKAGRTVRVEMTDQMRFQPAGAPLLRVRPMVMLSHNRYTQPLLTRVT